MFIFPFPGRNYTVSTTYFYTADQIGSTHLLTDGSGNVVSSNEFYPYGQGAASTTQNHYLFSGKERDSESGLDYFGARYYTSGIGRFMSADWSAQAQPVPYAKLDDPQTLNLYAYLRNNPISLVDPDGHWVRPDGGCCFSLFYPDPEASTNAGTAPRKKAEEEEKARKQPLSSVTILGQSVSIRYVDGLSEASELAASGKIAAAAALINSNADSLTSAEKKAIGQISTFTVAGSGAYVGATGKGSMTLTAGYLKQSSAAWLGSLFGHEGQHYMNRGLYSGQNLWRDEQSAGRTQLGIGSKIGFRPHESRYLEEWIDDKNRGAMQQHMLQGLTY